MLSEIFNSIKGAFTSVENIIELAELQVGQPTGVAIKLVGDVPKSVHLVKPGWEALRGIVSGPGNVLSDALSVTEQVDLISQHNMNVETNRFTLAMLVVTVLAACGVIGLAGYGLIVANNMFNDWRAATFPSTSPTPIVIETKSPVDNPVRFTVTPTLALSPTPTQQASTPVPSLFPTPVPTARMGEAYCFPWKFGVKRDQMATTFQFGLGRSLSSEENLRLRAMEPKKAGTSTKPCLVR